MLRIDLVIGIFASACAVTLLMFYLRRRGTLPDAVLGLLAHGGLAVGLVTGVLPEHPGRPDGTVVRRHPRGVPHRPGAVIWGGGALVLVVMGRIWRPLLAATVNVDLATVAGMLGIHEQSDHDGDARTMAPTGESLRGVRLVGPMEAVARDAGHAGPDEMTCGGDQCINTFFGDHASARKTSVRVHSDRAIKRSGGTLGDLYAGVTRGVLGPLRRRKAQHASQDKQGDRSLENR